VAEGLVVVDRWVKRAYCGAKWVKGAFKDAAQGASWEIRPVAGFLGRYEHSLDTKGRVILPAKFRVQFERGGYLTQHSEGCLALWTPGEFERQMAVVLERAGGSRTDRNRARLWASSSHEVEIDRQGRMPIPAHLRGFAGMESGVLVLGAIDRVELWSPERWEERVLPEESWLLDDGEE
jgi:MraZ protein